MEMKPENRRTQNKSVNEAPNFAPNPHHLLNCKTLAINMSRVTLAFARVNEDHAFPLSFGLRLETHNSWTDVEQERMERRRKLER